MKRFTISIVLTFFIITAFSQTVDCFLFSGDKKSKEDILKNSLFRYLKDHRNIAEFSAWYLSSFYWDEIIKNNNKIYKNRNTNNIGSLWKNLKDKNISDILDKSNCIAKYLNITKNLTFGKFLENKIGNLKATQISYNIESKNINETAIDSVVGKLDTWLKNIKFTILVDIDEDDIIFEYDGLTVQQKNEIKNSFISSLVQDRTSLQQIFTDKTLTLVSGNQTDPSSVCYKMAKTDNTISNKGFLANADYYFLVKIRNLRLNYKQVEGFDEKIWKIENVNIHIELHNSAANKSIANYQTDLTDITGVTDGTTSHRELPAKLHKFIYAIISVEPLEIGYSHKTDGTFFMQLYKELSVLFNPLTKSTNGFPFRIFVQQVKDKNKNTPSTSDFTDILNKLEAKYNFKINKAVGAGANEGVRYVNVGLKNCYFRINPFKQAFKNELNSLINKSYEVSANSPNFFLLLCETSSPYVYLNECVIQINLKGTCPNTVFSGSDLTIKVEDEKMNTYPDIKSNYNEKDAILRIRLDDKDGKCIPYEAGLEYYFDISDKSGNTCSFSCRK